MVLDSRPWALTRHSVSDINSAESFQGREARIAILMLAVNQTCQPEEAGASLTTNQIESAMGGTTRRSTKQRRSTVVKVESASSHSVIMPPTTAHMQVHSEERPYLCQMCNKTFKRQISLDRHMLDLQ
jgi:hypothetical protein